jgi:hypothetical protein
MKRVSTAALAALVIAGTVACGNSQLTHDARSGNLKPPAPASTPGLTVPAITPTPQPDVADYGRLLLEAADISDHEDTFVMRSSQANPDELPGASALFVNANDTRAISNTIALYPDAATATATLRQAVANLNTEVSGGTPHPSPVGTDGTVITGTAPDGAMAVTLLLFTHGRALARLEFKSATGDATTDRFVTNIGKMQQIALRVGLDDSQ